MQTNEKIILFCLFFWVNHFFVFAQKNDFSAINSPNPQHQKKYLQWADSMNIHYFSKNNDILPKIKLAEQHLEYGTGYFFLKTITKNIPANCPKNDTICTQAKDYLDFLKINHYQVQNPYSKFFSHLIKGNFGYISLRISQKIQLFMAYYSDFLMLEEWAIYVLFLLPLVFVLISWKTPPKPSPEGRAYRKAFVLLSLWGLGCLVLVIFYVIFPKNTPKLIFSQKNSQDLYNQKNHKIGNVISFKSSQIKTYILQDDDINTAYHKFEDLTAKNQKNSISLLTSASFLDETGKQEGFCVQNGKIQNPTILPKYSVILYTKNNLLHYKHTQELNTIPKYADFLELCQTQKISAFQSQLLGIDNVLTISQNDKALERERRILCIVKSKKDNEIYYFVFNIGYAVRLYDFAEGIFNFLQKENFYMNAMVNLDTGSNNIFSFSTPNTLLDIKTSIFTIERAKNLIVFSR